ncbi:hypothetical protein [Nostoc sp. LPT]|uniref:hypothetical protein n=2 Tax=Nostoc TaxID=1177 RepID=UPI0025F3B35F|nr:hypothetical protein [Nostoc sp. LPT]
MALAMDRVSVVVQNADGNNHIAGVEIRECVGDKADDEFRDAGSILSRYRIQEWHLVAKQLLPKLIITKCKL